MASKVMVSTRKGLFEISKGRRGWAVDDAHFLGDNVTLTLHDPRDGTDYAALNHGHFGIKLQIAQALLLVHGDHGFFLALLARNPTQASTNGVTQKVKIRWAVLITE